MIVLGLTGSIGMGKSTAAAMLRRLGVPVHDADRAVHRLMAKGGKAVPLVARAFPDAVTGGVVDRAALGRIVFADPERLRTLETIVHPAVRPRLLAEVETAERNGATAIVIEAIKLVEGGLATLCDEVWLIVCARDPQRARLAARAAETGADPADAEARIATQSDLVSRLTPHATRVIDTSGTLAATEAAVREAFASAGPTTQPVRPGSAPSAAAVPRSGWRAPGSAEDAAGPQTSPRTPPARDGSALCPQQAGETLR
jgi:dephospho-CoA kinase